MRYILLSTLIIIAVAGFVLADKGDKPVKKIKIYIHTEIGRAHV